LIEIRKLAACEGEAQSGFDYTALQRLAQAIVKQITH
jgi:hypothetical protein